MKKPIALAGELRFLGTAGVVRLFQRVVLGASAVGGDSKTSKASKKISDATLNKIITETIEKELSIKGLSKQESGAQLIVTYVAGSFNHTEFENLGPLGQSPGQIGQSWSREYTQGSLIIDLNDSRNGDLIWRINSTTTTNAPEARQNVEQVVSKGFKKFSIEPKKKKK